MKLFHISRNSRSLIGIISISYLFFIAAMILLPSQLITYFVEWENVTGIILIGILLSLFPLLLLIAIIIYLSRLYRTQKRETIQHSGVGYRLRLIQFFFIIGILATIPQALMSITLFNTVLNTWVGPQASESVEEGLNLALESYEAQIVALRQIAQSSFITLPDNPDNIGTYLNSIWRDIERQYPQISAIQIFTPTENYFIGDSLARLSTQQRERITTNFSLRDSVGGKNLLRYSIMESNMQIILSIIIPEKLDYRANILTQTFRSFESLNRIRPWLWGAIALLVGYLTFPLFILTIAISILLTHNLLRPISHLEYATKRIADGDYQYRVNSPRNSLLGYLFESFNTMVVELNRSRQQLLQTDKITAWQEIAQELAHEIKNPLTPIKLSASRLRDKFNEKDSNFKEIFPNVIQIILKEVDYITQLLDNFRNFSKLSNPNKRECTLQNIIKKAAHTITAPNIAIDYSAIKDDVIVYVDRLQLEQVFTNLLRNACEALEDNGHIVMSAYKIYRSNTNFYRICLTDDGPGIDEQLYQKVFQPYFTTKETGDGLGLPIVERIIFEHGGQIWFESELGYGTTFFIDIPDDNAHNAAPVRSDD